MVPDNARIRCFYGVGVDYTVIMSDCLYCSLILRGWISLHGLYGIGGGAAAT